MAECVSATRLHELLLGLLRLCVLLGDRAKDRRPRRPFHPRQLARGVDNVLAEDYGRARDVADWLKAHSRWIIVPDGHPLDGQEFGKEAYPNRQPVRLGKR